MLTFLDNVSSRQVNGLLARAIKFIDACVPCKEKALVSKQASLFAHLANYWLFRGMLEYVKQKSHVEVSYSFREGLKEMAVALELGHKFDRSEIRNYFFIALIVNDRSAAHFLASLPEYVVERHGIYSLQTFILFLIFRSEESRAKAFLEILDGFSFTPSLLKEPVEKREDVQNLYRLIESVVKQSVSEFNRSLLCYVKTPRNGIEGKYTGSNLHFPDLTGLAICRLARDRGMTVTVDHPCLPLALLDIR